MEFILHPGQLNKNDISTLLDESTQIKLSPTAIETILQSQAMVEKLIQSNKKIYGVNTGFGSLARTAINVADLEILQKSLVLSHASGVGELFSDDVVRLILALKINSLARGFSGIRLETINALIQLYNRQIYPCIPSQGSVGASGDLAPLAHLSLVLIGEGCARYQNKIINAREALQLMGIEALTLQAKEGLALLNGTQVSTALALLGLRNAELNLMAALIAGCMSVDAVRGSYSPFDEKIQIVRGHPAQIKIAKIMRTILDDSEIHHSHENCDKVQEPYSIRCQPQVMGAILHQLNYVTQILMTEANAVSDNPIVFTKEEVILSGGNFHAQPVAFAADALAIAISEIGSMSERRTAILIDPNMSGLSAFLVDNPGLNSGFMIAQVTAAALVSENKSLCFPSSVDSIPTSANQEDHVSMATYAARRLLKMNENCAAIIAIELLAASQALDFLQPLQSTQLIQEIHSKIRKQVSFYEKDRYFAPDIECVKTLIQTGAITFAFMDELFIN